ncbi:MAG: phosphatase PAP2 family protein [Actinomycetota bacterium]|nr:phosphatase PAP2 family protein [Actinomycetota bacterium]
MTQDPGGAPSSLQDTLSPSAPGLPPESGVAVDLRQVVPDAAPSTGFLVILGAGTTLLFAALTVSVVQHTSAVSAADLQLHSWALVNRNELTIGLARWLTWGGATVVVLPALIVVGALASPGRRAIRSRIGSGMLLAGIASLGVYLGLLINAAVGGVRPLERDWAGTAGGPTFPSGHTTAATIFAAFVVWALAPHMRTTMQRILLVSAAAGWAAVVGLTRVWLGVHWPSDVLGGWLFGVAWASLAVAGVVTLRRRWARRAKAREQQSGS